MEGIQAPILSIGKGIIEPACILKGVYDLSPNASSPTVQVCLMQIRKSLPNQVRQLQRARAHMTSAG